MRHHKPDAGAFSRDQRDTKLTIWGSGVRISSGASLSDIFRVIYTGIRTAQTLVTRCDLLLFRAMTVGAIPYTCHREPRRQGSRSIPISQEIVATELGGSSGDSFA